MTKLNIPNGLRIDTLLTGDLPDLSHYCMPRPKLYSFNVFWTTSFMLHGQILPFSIKLTKNPWRDISHVVVFYNHISLDLNL